MSKIYVLLLALVSMLAFAALTVSAASASELLANAATISSMLEARILGTLTLTDTGVIGSPSVACEGIFDILIENGTLAFINEVLMDNGELLEASALNLAKEEVKGDDIECTPVKLCEGTTLVVVLNLPFHIELELIGSEYKMHFLNGEEEAGKEPTYSVDCIVFGFLEEDICDGLTLATLTEPVAGDVEASFNSQEANCSLGGAKAGLLEGKGLLEDNEAGVTFSLS